MFDHVSIGVRDVARSRKFYDAALEPLGSTCLSPDESSLGYGPGPIGFWVLKAASPVAEDVASGLHVCFAAPTRASVDAFYSAALKAGGGDNGAPGVRESYGPTYYAAFVVDPDGYRLEAYCAGA